MPSGLKSSFSNSVGLRQEIGDQTHTDDGRMCDEEENDKAEVAVELMKPVFSRLWLFVVTSLAWRPDHYAQAIFMNLKRGILALGLMFIHLSRN